jgi:hypothetical protein
MYAQSKRLALFSRFPRHVLTNQPLDIAGLVADAFKPLNDVMFGRRDNPDCEVV